MKLARTIAVAAAATGLALLPSAANAASLLRTDAVGDVQSFNLDDESEEPALTAEPARTIGDITKTRITHNDTSVRIEMYYKALPKAGVYNSHSFRIVTDRLEREVAVEAGTGNWVGKATEYYKSGSKYSCTGLKHLIDYTNHRVIVTVPRSCLGNPRFVKVGGGFVSVAGSKVYLDDGQVTAGALDNLTLSPGVSRG